MAIHALALAGLAGTIGFVLWVGLHEVMAVVSSVGWWICYLSLFVLLAQIAAALSWRRLFPESATPPFKRLYLATWVSTAVNSVLPAASIGGEAARARLLMIAGESGTTAGTSILLVKTVEALGIVAIGAIALAALFLARGTAPITLVSFAGWFLLALCVAAFVALQSSGMLGRAARKWMARAESRLGGRLAGVLAQVDESLLRFYRQPRPLAESLLFMLAFRLAMIGELYLIAAAIGNPIPIESALILEGLSAAFKGLIFVLPAGIGLQEASYVALGAALGLDPSLMLGLSLARRAIDIVTAAPALIAWQLKEGRLLSTH